MKKKIFILIFTFLFIFTGCSNKENLKNEVNTLLDENKKLEAENSKYKEIESTLDFYNEISSSTISSFVLIESVSMTNRLYTNGAIIMQNNYYYYAIVDYDAIKQSKATFNVMDSNGNVYSASFYKTLNENLGLAMLVIDTNGYSNVSMKAIKMGDYTDLMAYISSVKQINKIQVINEIEKSEIMVNDSTYATYIIDNSIDNGSGLVNQNNELCGIYLSKINRFISSQLLIDLLAN